MLPAVTRCWDATLAGVQHVLQSIASRMIAYSALSFQCCSPGSRLKCDAFIVGRTLCCVLALQGITTRLSTHTNRRTSPKSAPPMCFHLGYDNPQFKHIACFTIAWANTPLPFRVTTDVSSFSTIKAGMTYNAAVGSVECTSSSTSVFTCTSTNLLCVIFE